MKLLTKAANAPSPAAGAVADEIAFALQQHHRSAKGLILGLEKYRQLRARTIVAAGSYQGISLIIDASQPLRISVF